MACEFASSTISKRNSIPPFFNWNTKVICFLWERFFLLWKSRNEVVFGDTPAEARQSTITKVLVELRHLHSQRDQHRPCDVSFLMSPAAAHDDQIFSDTIHRQGVYRVQNWLETWKQFFRHSLQRKVLNCHRPRPPHPSSYYDRF
jgi:hypothetical protein